MKGNKKLYYIGLKKSNNRMVISPCKQEIADLLDISVRTISRHLINTSIYDTEDYTIWKNVPINKIKRGFAL